MKRWVLFLAIFFHALGAKGQKNYATNSVLSSGKWVKIATAGPGVYKVTGSFLTQAGFASPISSSAVLFFGQSGAILEESNVTKSIDDLKELQIEMFDGGDGSFDKEDYFLFYCPGSNQWVYDSLTRRFQLLKNYYTDISYYFIQVGAGSGLRIKDKIVQGVATISTQQFTEHIRVERDSFNFLNSGREWYGHGFGLDQPITRSFTLANEGVIPGSQFELTSEIVGRSFDSPNKLNVSINGRSIFQHTTAPVIGTLLEPVANVSRLSAQGNIEASSIVVKYDFTPGSANGQAWLNWFEVVFRRELKLYNDSLQAFRDPLVQAPNQIVSYVLSSSNPELKIWEVSEIGAYYRVPAEYIANQLRFKDKGDKLREYIVFDPKLTKQPKIIGTVVNQNLHGEGFYDMVIVSEPTMLSEAKRLAQFRQSNNGIRVLVTDPITIYNEFSAGNPDPSAIRNFMKMLYDRAGNNIANRPKYLLLFGATSFKYKEDESERKNLIPSFQSQSSLDPLTSYVTDDFFGYLDDGDDINTNIPAPMLDLAVGRIPARTLTQAKTAVDKIIAYQSQSDFGPWRNQLTLVADDEDFDLHFQDAEAHAAIVERGETVWNLNKIYLDAFQQIGGTGGSRYPEVNSIISKSINQGTLVWNYSGHGGNSRLAQEVILEKEMIASWQNQKRLPLFITATCDFAPFDNPAQFSIGEDLLLGRLNGAIGLMTTTRLVFASSNKLINNNFLQSLLQKNLQGFYPTIGDAWLRAKNTTVLSAGDFINARKFAMLGDPSMKLLMPEYIVKTGKLVDVQTNINTDTIRALNKYKIEGAVFSPNGAVASDFNGLVYISIHDKAINAQTRANDPQSSVRKFKVFDNLIYYGKSQVQSGKFAVEFIVPNDIRFEYGSARVSYYAEDGNRDAQGIDESFVVGGFGGQAPNDKTGPLIQGSLDNINFPNTGTVSEEPLLVAQVSDQSGIYLGRFGLGHDIRLTIDGDYANPIVLNDFFQPVLAENKAGEIKFKLPKLSEGNHKIEIKAWDVFNNSSSVAVDFVVKPQQSIEITSFYNYPNPFNNATNFTIQTTGPTLGAELQLEILSTQGKILHKMIETINQAGLRSFNKSWDRKDGTGKLAPSGVYFARLIFKTKSGIISSKTHRLVVD